MKRENLSQRRNNKPKPHSNAPRAYHKGDSTQPWGRNRKKVRSSEELNKELLMYWGDKGATTLNKDMETYWKNKRNSV